jgi:hypothetical protein
MLIFISMTWKCPGHWPALGRRPTKAFAPFLPFFAPFARNPFLSPHRIPACVGMKNKNRFDGLPFRRRTA